MVAMATAEKMRIWFRHSGQPPVSWEDVRKATTKSYATAEVKREVGSYDITDLKLEETIPNRITEIASKALCLCVCYLTDRASLDNLCQLTQLEKLSIGWNPLKTVPEVVSSLTSLKELNMGNCKLSTLPESLCQLTQLEKLNIGGNSLNTVPEVVSSFTSLKGLDMENCELSTLPESLCQLTQLEKLVIGLNPLKTLPEVVSSFTSLKELYMWSCELSTLPESLCQLTQLEKLYIGWNYLNTVPEVVSSLTSLKELNMRSCKIPTLPESLCQLTQLEKLNIGENPLNTVPEVVSSFTSLKELDMWSCELSTLPESLCQLTQLEQLDIGLNPLKTVPEVVSSLTSLTEFNMWSCKISTLPESLCQLTQLEKLNIGGNSLNTVPEVVSSLTSLKELVMDSCELSTLPESLCQLTQLEKLDIEENPLKTVPEVVSSLTSLTELNMENCKLSTLPESLCRLTQLKKLNIAKNPLNTVPEVVSSLTSLKELDMKNCELSTLPESLCQLTQLEKLDIGLNPLKTVPEVVSSLTSLKELNMKNCKLSTLHASLCQLTQLEKLNIAKNSLNTVPEVVSSLTSLKELDMWQCELSDLPERIQRLQKLQKLNISYNKFSSLPSPVCALSNLHTLNISNNTFMESLNPEILELTHLGSFYTDGCDALTSPPLEVCKRGPDAVRQYYTDLAKGAGRNLPFATIAVLGNTMAGKTSLIRTLQSTDKKRVLTDRSPNAEHDETTKVFNVEEVEVDGTTLRLIDMGGQEVYHITYHLTLRQNCVPVIVVNMEQYDQISKTSTDREAVRKLAFDFMSHLYLAHPSLGPPKLVFTHKDKFPSEVFQQLRRKFLEVSEQLCRNILEEEKSLEGEFARIQHFTESNGKVFSNDNIYEVGKFDEYMIFELIKKSLLQSCQHFVKPLPKVWEDVNTKVLSLQSAHNTFDEILAEIKKERDDIDENQLDTVLMYMHDCGKVLWYKNVDALRPYIFHKITEVTKLLCVLYHHDPNIWQSRVDQFKPYFSKGVRIEKQDIEESVNYFKATGLMTQSLLEYVIAQETSFSNPGDVEIGLRLLSTFRLLYGPRNDESDDPFFIIPQFAKDSYSIPYTPPKELLLHTETQFNGLALPQHVYHQMTVGLLELFSKEFATMDVKRNGANVYQDEIYTLLIHDYALRRVLLYVSSGASNISRMWEKLISINNNILRRVMETWTASRPVTACICAHCLLLGVSCPKKLLHPKWCLRSLKNLLPPNVRKCGGSSKMLCNEEEVPSALIHPCEKLSETETNKLKKLVAELKLRGDQNNSTEMLADDLSDLSEDDDNLYPDGENGEGMKLIQLEFKPTTNPKIKQLFSDTDKVFSMTRKRGKALIINNKHFVERPDLCREGSDVDVENMSFMLKSLKFDVETHTDLTAEEMLSAVKSEMKREKNNGLGSQILVIMTHGVEDNCIYGTDLEKVNLTDLYDLLAPLSLKPKPTVVILEACSGVTIEVNLDRSDLAAAQDETEAVPSTHSAADDDIVYPETPIVIRPIRPVFLPEYRIEEYMTRLDVDNLLVLKSNVWSSKKHPEYGSPMIRALVSSIYKHACHRDLYTIFQQVQTKLVKKLYADEDSERSRNLVVIWNTLPPRKRFYLFPGFDGFGEEAKS